MRSTIVPVALLLASLAVAAESTWPSKGATVYIAASFKGLTPPPIVAGAKVTFDMPPCAEAEIVKAIPQKSMWVMKDPLGGRERLEGAWLVRMHKTKSECETQLSAEGEPSVTRSGTTFTIKTQESK